MDWIRKKWILLIFIIGQVTILLLPTNTHLKEIELINITIIASEKVKEVSSRYKSYLYSVRDENYKCNFIINSAVNFIPAKPKLKELSKGDTLTAQISYYDKANLFDSSINVYIYSIYKNNIKVFTSEEYVNGARKQNFRIKAFILLSLYFSLFITLELKNRKAHYLILLILTVIVIIMMEKSIL